MHSPMPSPRMPSAAPGASPSMPTRRMSALSEVTVLVEDFVPDRTEFDLKTDAKAIGPGNPATIHVAGRFLYGAPAANLDLEAEILLNTVRERPDSPGFQFGLADEEDQWPDQDRDRGPRSDRRGRQCVVRGGAGQPAADFAAADREHRGQDARGGRQSGRAAAEPSGSVQRGHDRRASAIRRLRNRRKQRREILGHRGRSGRQASGFAWPEMELASPRAQLSMVSRRQLLALRIRGRAAADLERHPRHEDRRSGGDFDAGRVGQISPHGRNQPSRRSGDQRRIPRRLVCRGNVGRHARCARSRARPGQL